MFQLLRRSHLLSISDDVEQALQTAPINPQFNSKKYVKQNFGDKWRDYMYQQWGIAVRKQQKFLDDEVPKINTFFNYNPGGDDKDAGEDGDTKNTDDDSDTEMGGTEDNRGAGQVESSERCEKCNDQRSPKPLP
ncbi:hypothetical protein CBS147333_10324 [Penicillium roqueforti]|nr:hypothetical protein CBS147333_10324 [Penicillium roqueforti]